MNYELTQRFHFDAAHTLKRDIDTESSRRIHGHTYTAEVTIAGQPDPATGMLLDLGHLRKEVEGVRQRLDHRLLDEVQGLEAATLEGLCSFLWAELSVVFPGLSRIVVGRDASGDRCSLQREKSLV
jgi:6-pyruvoyltetrahydropterin/6-carboxytetrahydropterin synthase